MPTFVSISLFLSLVFAIGQIVVGAGVACWLLLRQRWRKANLFILFLLSIWFVCSGVTELFVSGMEASHDLRGMPTSAIFALWRGRADSFLLVATVVLVVVGVPIAAWLRLRASHAVAGQPQPPEHGSQQSGHGRVGGKRS